MTEESSEAPPLLGDSWGSPEWVAFELDLEAAVADRTLDAYAIGLQAAEERYDAQLAEAIEHRNYQLAKREGQTPKG